MKYRKSLIEILVNALDPGLISTTIASTMRFVKALAVF
jgi:hypothetical protein